MQHNPQPLDYRTAPRLQRVRPRLWLSFMLTTALLCPVALLVDRELRYDSEGAMRVIQIEIMLAIWGLTCAIVSFARGALKGRDKILIACCLLIFAFTAFVGLLMPRVIHN